MILTICGTSIGTDNEQIVSNQFDNDVYIFQVHYDVPSCHHQSEWPTNLYLTTYKFQSIDVEKSISGVENPL